MPGSPAQPKMPGYHHDGAAGVEHAPSFESLESGDMPIAMARRATAAVLPQHDPAGMVMMKQSAQVQQVRPVGLG